MNAPVLEVRDLRVELATAVGGLKAVRGVSFAIARGETFALVGESGSGKSMTALALLDLLPRNARRSVADLRLDGVEIGALSEPDLRRLRGNAAAMVFQEPMTALNPVLTIGEQMTEGLLTHMPETPSAVAARRAIDLLARCGVSEPERRLLQFPHELSGGLRQRVMIATALMTGPRLLIADEPTTALDVTVQAQILDLLRELQRDLDLAILFITHDLALVRRFAARVGVMYAGRIVESGPTGAVVDAPSHPYTRRLLACAPSLAAPRGHRLGFLSGLPPRLLGTPVGCQFRARCDVAADACAADPPLRESAGGVAYECIHPPVGGAVRGPDMPAPTLPGAEADAGMPDADPVIAAPLLRAQGVTVTYRLRGGFLARATTLTAVRDASLEIPAGRVLGLVGESGSGKSTLARVVLGLETPQAGEVTIGGMALGTLDRRARARAVQPVFQDPYTSLNPRRTIGEIVRAPLDILGLHARDERADVAAAMLERCGLPRHMLGAYPVQLSGGQRQRVAIARALVSGPRLVVCDEPTSALDVSIQSQILNLLQDLQASLGLTYLFISHNLAVVRHLAHRVAVMHRGVLVETGDAEQIFADPQHPYTRQLIAAAPG